MERNGTASLNCASCLNDLDGDGFVTALGQDWHKDCFRCSVCDVLLSTWYFEKGGLLFCQDDYWTRFGECCQHCTQVITGPVMSAGSHRFHPECFACVLCGANIEDGESYALVERSKLYCGGCYNKEASMTSTGHSIRALTVPRDALTRQVDHTGPMQASCSHSVRDKLTLLARAILSICIQLTCHRIDSPCGLLTFHIGDRILEINGTPVLNRPVHEIEKVLACSDTVLQLTIEHDPDNTNTRNNQMCKLSIEESNPIITPNIQLQPVIVQKHSQKDIPKENYDIPDHLLIRNNIDIPKLEIVDGEEVRGKKERLFKRKGEGLGKVRMIKRKQTPSSPLLGDKERSSSMSKLLDAVENVSNENVGVLCDLSRARSFRAHHDTGQKVFRACDLLQGELLGSGFFGEVYKVTHRDTGEVMVLKQLYRVDEDAQRNFLKEVAVLRSLSHPNVLHFIGVLYKDKRLHLVTEYVAGGTLQQLLQDSNATLDWSERVRLARDIAAGVGYLHRMNIIHRDLNSHNCLVREDKTVIVADFGLARIVQRTASSTPHQHQHSTLRRKRYTVVGNPYWMAPEMMNGKLYDEKVDVFSFGIILCEIIGRVQADPDFLPRRGDFGLNEVQFLEKFCDGCPEPFYRVAFLACHLDPDFRPPFEVTEIWLESLVMHLATPGPLPANLLADILQYSHHGNPEHAHATPEWCQHEHSNIFCTETLECCQCKKCGSSCAVSRSPSKQAVSVANEMAVPECGVIKSKSNATMPQNQEYIQKEESKNGRALGKCVSASHICQSQRPIVTITNLSRSQNALANTPAGYILRAEGRNINITKVDDITEWIDQPPPLKRSSPDSHLNNLIQEHTNKTRKVVDGDQKSDNYETNLPSFLRNQSVEGLESQSKHDIDAPLLICRHFSIPDNDSDSSDDDLTMCDWYKNVSSFKRFDKMEVDQPKNILAGIVKKSENLLAKKSSYDVTDVTLRNPDCLKGSERKIPEVDCRRFNINYVAKNPLMAEGLKNIPKFLDVPKIDKNVEKTNFFTKKLLSPKLSRLFKPNTAEVQRNKAEVDDSRDERSRSKFFIQRPASPSNIRSHRVRPMEEPNLKLDKNIKIQHNLLKSDIKLANLGKPMTPIFRRHIPNEKNEFVDGRFSYRERRSTKYDVKNPEPTFVDMGKNKIKAPVPNAKIMDEKFSPISKNTHFKNSPLSVLNKPLSNVDAKVNKVEKKEKETVSKRREPAISRSNYVSLANLRINSKNKDIEKTVKDKEGNVNDCVPIERVI